MSTWHHRLDRLEERHGTELHVLGPTEEERELARRIRENPRLRKVIAHCSDPFNLSDEELAQLIPEDRHLLEQFFALE